MTITEEDQRKLVNFCITHTGCGKRSPFPNELLILRDTTPMVIRVDCLSCGKNEQFKLIEG